MPRNNNEYWVGPAGVLIPNTVDEVPSLDNMNTCFRSGYHRKPYTVSQYRKQFAEYRRGKWYWKPAEIFVLERDTDYEIPESSIIDKYVRAPLNKLFPNDWETHKNNLVNCYWKGPLDIMIPNIISTIPGINGGVVIRDDDTVNGYKHLNQGSKVITRNQEKDYKNRYATLRDDGKWYWNIQSTTLPTNKIRDSPSPFILNRPDLV